ncbi:ScyD/ScyE family protein [Labedaea rhizosphaerae]|uniref:ScyD/ScyE family protein n=1 Tax=Labedaea rhizosphaerae TaxID=598644 RepID=UPI001FB6E5A6|nr:ScyD/ScyE family protein [Labedaea rhizosphaerae]
MTVIASGLDNPRGLAFARDGSLYVAEAGAGGAGPCQPGPEGGEVCFGTSGAITKIGHGHQYRVLAGLPSTAAPDGSQAIGPSDVTFKDGRLTFTVGLGADPAVRADLPAAGRNLGWLLQAGRHGVSRIADIAGYEAVANPDGGVPDSNPNSVLATSSGYVVADAGGNDLVKVSGRHHTVSTIATFPSQMVDAPPFLGLPPGTQIPMEAVPTSVVRGPDGAYYVGQLTGFPFVPGKASVWRVVPGHAPKIVARGFTNIIDLGFDRRGTLYVLEIAKNGLLSEDPTGALIKVGRHGEQHVVMSTGLITPGGLALRGDAAYVSNCGTCAGGGQVLRISLR